MRSDNVIMAGVLGEGELWLWPVSGPGLHQSTLWLRQSHLSHRGQSQSHGTTPGTSVALHQTRPESRWYCTWSTHWLHTLSLCHRWCSSPQHRTRNYSTKDNPLYISNKSSQIYQQLICNCFLYLYAWIPFIQNEVYSTSRVKYSIDTYGKRHYNLLNQPSCHFCLSLSLGKTENWNNISRYFPTNIYPILKV